MKRWIEKKFTGGLISLAVVMMVVMFIPPGAMAADDTFQTNIHWKTKVEYISGTAAEAIKTGDTLAYNKYSGKVQKADMNDRDRMPCIGLAGNNAAANGAVQIVRKGILSGVTASWAYNASYRVTPYGTPLTVGPNPGGVTTYIGARGQSGITQFVGTALPMSEAAAASGVTGSTDTYFVNVQDVASGVSPYF